MRERTRIAERNMRMVLTLIDGKATVADLCAKTGNSPLAEKALRELERGGFIETRAAKDLLMAQSRDLEQEIKTAAQERTSEFSTFGDKYGDVAGQPATGPTPQPGMLERLKAMLDKSGAEAGRRGIKPIRRGSGRASRKWAKRGLLAVFSLLVLAALTAAFFPYNRYLPEVETALARASGLPAKVGEVSVGVYPKPGLLLADVRLGSEADGKAIRVAGLRILPDIGSLLEPKKHIRQIELSGVTLPAEAVGGFFRVFDALAQPSSPVGVRRVTLEKTDVGLRGLGFSDLGGEVKLAPDGRFDALILVSADRSLRLEARPQGDGLDIALEGAGWRPAPGSPIFFDSLAVKGQLDGNVFSIKSMILRVFDGRVHGLATLRAGTRPEMDGELAFERINAKRLGEALGVGPQFEGEIAGTMKFSSSAASWADILSVLQADGEFTVGRGSMNGFDFAEAARRGPASPVRGGATRFEQVQGKFRLAPENWRFHPVTIGSGLMQSGGQVTVGKDLRLSGEMEVQMRGTVNQMQALVSLGGTLAAPVLQAGKR